MTTGPARLFGTLVIIAGIILFVAGIVTYYVVHVELADQRITVSSDSSYLAGDDVDGPFSAYAEANTIGKHADEIGGGKTYSELPQDDPKRTTVMTASFLQASLFTSVVAFGVAALAAALGIVCVLLGWGLRAVAKATPTTMLVAAPPTDAE
jgi:hypothetical protein